MTLDKMFCWMTCIGTVFAYNESTKTAQQECLLALLLESHFTIVAR